MFPLLFDKTDYLKGYAGGLFFCFGGGAALRIGRVGGFGFSDDRGVSVPAGFGLVWLDAGLSLGFAGRF